MVGMLGAGFLLIAIAIAFYGWGILTEKVVARALRWTDSPAADIDHATLGVSGLLAVGGALNAIGVLYRPTYLALFAVGLVSAAIALATRWRQIDRQQLLVILAAAAVALPWLVGSLFSKYFNLHDDHYAYLVMPARIVQTGMLTPDPFNYRAAVAGAGGIAFLQAPVLDWLGIHAVRLIDQGAGLLLLLSATTKLFRRLKVAPAAGLVLLIGFFAVAQHPIVNITSYFLTYALLIALLHLLWSDDDDGPTKAAYAAILLAAVVALKNTAMPLAGLLSAAIVLRQFRRTPRRAWLEAAVFAVTVGVVVVVWYLPRMMVKVRLIHLGYGTGEEEVSAGYILSWITDDRWDWMYFAASFALTAIAVVVVRGHLLRVVGVMTAVTVGAAVAIGASGGMAITRFGQPLFLVGYLLLAALVVARYRSRTAVLVAVSLVAGMVCFRQSPLTHAYAKEYIAAAKAVVTTSTPMPPAERGRLRAVQESMEIRTAAVVNLGYPFLLDFTRNDVYVVDFPFAAGPPPGVPDGSAEELVRYLRANRVRYVVYDYASEANFSDAEVARRLTNPRFTPWQRRLNRQVPLFHARLREIADRWPTVFKDENTWVVDLEAKGP